MPNEPIAHLVWLQGRRAADDVEDYYEVARPGDKSVDGSDPFPVYAAVPHLAKPVDGERHEGEPVGWQLVPKAMDVKMIGAWYRYKNGWHSHDDPVPRDTSDTGAWAALLAAAPPPPAAVQEPVAVKEITLSPVSRTGAPERLWLGAANEDGEHYVWFDPDDGGTLYLRANLDPTKTAIAAAKAAYWHETHNGGGYSDKCYEAAIRAALITMASEG
ncbi:hypothetical protein [Rhizobium rhizogenes]|uniref:hypothetical protein n=1 Tax=Rhizobium rhizogenes TaxID=359 RepID=UPI001574218E|nr:hypothetical protein [Rhizobium rhizogenes]NTG07185.1 hypothetical protein [Rhizobium rhizogenes]